MMNHKSIFSVLLFTFFLLEKTQAQPKKLAERIEVGIAAGPMFFLGDLGGNTGSGTKFLKDVNLKSTKLSIGGIIGYQVTDWLAFRLAGTVGEVFGDDALSPAKTEHDIYRLNRNLNFKSGIQEFYAGIELYPFALIPFKEGSFAGKIQPYVVGGAGIFHFNPEVRDNDGSWVRVHDLRLEGQGFTEYPNSKTYKLTQKNLQFGVGLKFRINETTSIGFEVVERKLFTDYVDDVSQNYYVDPATFDTYLTPANAATAKRLYYRGKYAIGTTLPSQAGLQRGNPSQNDSYFNSSITFGKRIFARNGDPRAKCPTVY